MTTNAQPGDARRTVLIVGRLGVVVEDAERHLDMPDVRLLDGTGLADVQRALATEPNIDHVAIGAGLDVQTRLAIVREILEHSERTSVHMKDRRTGPEGFLPFIRAVLHGLAELQD